MENCGNNLFDNEEAVNELSDADLLKLEQALKYTAEFIGVNTQNIQGGTGYRAIQADFPMFDYFNFPNPFEFLLYLIDPMETNIRQVRNSFPMLSPSEQMEYLHTKYNEGMRKNGRDRGWVAKDLRNLRSQMKLNGLFNINEPFMNVELREFLNLNENGEDIYTLRDMETSGWSETSSWGSRFHQNKAEKTRVTLRNYRRNIRHIYTRLNAKFTHTDGREAVFNYKEEYVTELIDRGTYNYRNVYPNPSDHQTYDVAPYKKRFANEIDPNIEKLHNGNGREGSYYWRYQRYEKV
jgi:hypothetical protein